MHHCIQFKLRIIFICRFGDIVDFEEDFIEKGGKINELRYSDCRRFLVLGVTDTVVICEVTF